MRIIFEQVDGEYFLEMILTKEDWDLYTDKGEIIKAYMCFFDEDNKLLNIHIRKEKE